MKFKNPCPCLRAFFAVPVLLFLSLMASLGANTPSEVGQLVNGFQDDFDGTTLQSGWTARGQTGVYAVNNGVLRISSADGDPNHLLYEVPGYSSSGQEVLARIRVLQFGAVDGSRGGVSVAVDPSTSQGLNWHFRDRSMGRSMQFLDDARAWGPELFSLWELNTWYWLRLKHDPNADQPDVFAKIWLADGTEAEPADWETWDYFPAQSARSGYAGLAAGSLSGLAEFEVDYLLIKASGLPTIKVSPQAFPAFTPGPAVIVQQPLNQTVDEGKPAVFTVGVDGTPPYQFQWYINNQPIAKATNYIYTLPAAGGTDNGVVFKAAATNSLGSATSSNAVLTVRLDSAPPALSSVANSGNSAVTVVFSEPVLATTATAATNYSLNNGVTVFSAAFGADEQTVVLTTSPLTIGANYTLTVNNVRDRSSSQNPIAPNTRINFTAVTLQVPGVLRQVYTGIPGVLVSDLTNAPAFPNNPTSEEIMGSFEAPTDVDDNYGQRMMAYLTPPTTGNYTFWIASDDASTLFLSTDDNPIHKSAIAYVSGWTPARTWTVYPEQQSAPVRLTSGQRYYLEALMKEEAGGDNLAVRWQLPDGAIEEPIPGSRLLVYGLGPPVIAQPPTNLTVMEGGTALFTVQLTRAAGVTYQWLRNNANIPNATNSSYTLAGAVLNDSNARFRCLLVNSQGTALSSEAVLTVTPDTTPPALVSVGSLGDPTVLTVLFSEPVEAASALAATNYLLSGGLSILGASFAGDGQTVVLKTSPLSLGVNYTLTVSNIRDRASTPNTIAANTQKDFSPDYTPLDIGFVKGTPEPLGPSNRRTGLVISEIMYHPAPRADGRNLEFLELFNSNDWPEDLSGYRLTAAVDFTFPSNTVIAARAFLVVAAVPADVQTVYGLAKVLGPFTNNLPNDSGTIRLRNRNGGILVEAKYASEPPYPMAADGAGHSLVLARPSFGEGDFRAWSASDLVGGSPGREEPSQPDPYRTVLINELLTHTDAPEVDFIELFNYSKTPVNLSGCFLTDDPSTNKFRIPEGATIPALGFLVYDQNQLGFALSSGGETVYLVNSNQTRVIDAIRFGAQEKGVSIGRYPDGAPNFQELSTPTPGASNTRFRPRDLVINEVMYDPLSGDGDDEYLELYNRGSAPVTLGNHRNLGAFKLAGGISYTFPAQAVIPAGGYILVAKNAAHLQTNYAQLNAANTFGNYQGSLGNGGDRIVLTLPEDVITTNEFGNFITNINDVVVDEVAYGNGGRWGQWSHGEGSSLELVDARSDNRLAPNWADSDESAKAPWTTVSCTGVLDNGNGAADELQLFLQDAGECLVDDVEVFVQGGPNLVANATFENGLTGWVPQGNHDRSDLDNTGYNSGHCLHVRALGRGDQGANRIRVPLTSSLSPGATATLRAKVRWLKGHPEILLRLHGNWLEAIGQMIVPANLGTPAAPNSRALANLGPAIFNVTHRPVLPAAGQPVTVTAQVQDPDGLASVIIKYRADPATNLASLSMVYNGAGFYSATIPGQAAGVIIAFSVQAADLATPSAASRFPQDAPSRECLIRFGETQPAGNFGAYRIWLTQATVNQWTRRLQLDNGPLDATFVYGNSRVIYNLGALYSGSPWIAPGYNGPLGSLCGYVLDFPADDLFLGSSDFVLDWPIRDDTQQLEQMAHWIADQLGLPSDHRRFVNLFVNGNRRGTIYEDAQQPGGDVVEEWYADEGPGDLFKIDDWFEFSDNAVKEFNVDATLQNFTTTGGAKKLARYRWNWRKRATDKPNDYAALFALVDAVNAPGPEPYTSRVESLVDVEQWMGVFAVEHLVGNWDSYGYSRGKNMFTYKPASGKFHLLMWDIDFVMSAGGDGPTTSMFNVNDSVMSRLMSHPPFLRTYYRIWYDAVNGPLNSSKYGPAMDARYAGLQANGIAANSPAAAKDYLNSRRNYLLQELAKVNSPFTITLNNGQNFSTNKNLITLTGKAPVGIKTIEINGITYPLTWTTVTSWNIRVPLAPGANPLLVKGFDTWGNLFSNAVLNLTIDCTAVPEAARDRVVINEIMYHPRVSQAAYVELFNTSTATAFDLSLWRLNGVDYTFPEGTLLLPQAFLVVAEDPAVFAQTYGANIPVIGPFAGQLDHGGETLSLVKPGATPDQDSVIDEVTYDDQTPWPLVADGQGPSLQLIDAAQDNRRVANWTAAATNAALLYTPGTNNSTRGAIAPLPSLWINEVQPENLTGPVTVAGQHTPWIEIYNSGASNLNLGQYYLTDTYTNLQKWSFPSSLVLTPGQFLIVWCDGQTNGAGSEVHANFGLLAGSGSVALVRMQNGQPVVFDYVNYTQVLPDYSYGSYPDGQPGRHQSFFYGSPGTTNNPADPPARLLVNEWMAANTSTLADPADGHYEDWFELYNAGDQTIDLSRFTLTDNSTNKTKFEIPRGYAIRPGEFLLVWADDDTGQNGTSGELHVNFKLSQNGEYIGLFSPHSNLVDEITFTAQTSDVSQGRWPDGHPSNIYFMPTPTPGAGNIIPGAGQTNSAPVLNPVADRTIDENQLLTFGATATDVDQPAQRLSFSLGPGAPPGAAINAVSGQFSWTPLESQGPGVYTLTIVVTDNGIPRLSDAKTFTVTVNEMNSPPVLSPVSEQTAVEDLTLLFTASAYDPDLPPQNLTFSLEPGAPAGAMINPGSGVFTWTPSRLQVPSTNYVTIRVTDDGSPQLSAAQTVKIMAFPTNHPPVISAIPDQVVDEKTALSLVVSASDPDAGQTFTFSLQPGFPPGMGINGVTGEIVWTPTEAQGPSTNSVTVRVTDNGEPSQTAAQTFKVTVREINLAPSLTTIANQTISMDDTLALQLQATDPDIPTNRLTFSLEPGAPTGASIGPSTGLLTWTPVVAQANTTNLIGVRITDDGVPALSDVKTFQVYVTPEPRWCYVTVTGTASASVLYIYLDRAGDAYIDDLRLVAGNTTDTGVDVLSNGDFESPLDGAWSVSPNLTSSSLSTMFKHSGNSSLHVVASSGGTTRASSIYQDIVPALPSNAEFTLSYWFLPGTNNTGLIIRLSGSGILSSTNLVPLENHPPSLDSLADWSVKAGQTVQLMASASHPDTEQTLTYSLAPGFPAGASITGDGRFTWAPTLAQAPSTNRITVRVDDNGLPPLFDTQSFLVTVQVPVEIRFNEVTLEGDNQMLMRWNADIGVTYRLQYKNSLSATTWLDLTEIIAPASEVVFTNRIDGSTQQFYRLQRQ